MRTASSRNLSFLRARSTGIHPSEIRLQLQHLNPDADASEDVGRSAGKLQLDQHRRVLPPDGAPSIPAHSYAADGSSSSKCSSHTSIYDLYTNRQRLWTLLITSLASGLLPISGECTQAVLSHAHAATRIRVAQHCICTYQHVQLASNRWCMIGRKSILFMAYIWHHFCMVGICLLAQSTADSAYH